MNLKSDSKGMTLVELLVAISLLTVVLFSGYLFLSFAYRSMAGTETEFETGQDARMSLMEMENHIRQAQSVTYNSVRHKAVEVTDGGMGLDVYVNIDNDTDFELVQYRVIDQSLKMRESELNGSPGEWYIVVNKVKIMKDSYGMDIPIFTIDTNSANVSIKMYITAESDKSAENPVCVEVSYTVRNKGAMDS